jgi:hypothetical protein
MIGRYEEPDAKLAAIAQNLTNALPGCEHVGVSVTHADGRAETLAATSDLVHELDDLQYRLGEGPCVDTLRGELLVQAPRIAHDTRWPRYTPPAVERGLKSQVAVKLYLDTEKAIGGLNIYGTSTEDIDPGAVRAVEVFAAEVAATLGHEGEISSLRQAMLTRQHIGEAVGLIMAKYHLDPDAAFDYLVRISSHSNLKVREIAEQLVADHVRNLPIEYAFETAANEVSA